MRLAAIAAVVAALVLAGCGGDEEPEDAFPPTETGAVPSGGLGEEALVDVALEPRGGSGVTGTARLTPDGEGGTVVEVRLRGDLAADEEYRGVVQLGPCDDPDASVVDELEPFEAGISETMLDRALEDLLAGDFAVAVRGADGDPVACAPIAPAGG